MPATGSRSRSGIVVAARKRPSPHRRGKRGDAEEKRAELAPATSPRPRREYELVRAPKRCGVPACLTKIDGAIWRRPQAWSLPTPKNERYVSRSPPGRSWILARRPAPLGPLPAKRRPRSRGRGDEPPSRRRRARASPRRRSIPSSRGSPGRREASRSDAQPDGRRPRGANAAQGASVSTYSCCASRTMSTLFPSRSFPSRSPTTKSSPAKVGSIVMNETDPSSFFRDGRRAGLRLQASVTSP